MNISKSKSSLLNTIEFFLFIFFFSLILAFYYDAFSHYFYQDDFFHFYISKAQNFKDFLDFFSPLNKFNYQVYRPLSTQLLFFIYQSFFGINHTLFQLMIFLIFSFNILLLFKLFKRYTRRIFALLLAFIYIA